MIVVIRMMKKFFTISSFKIRHKKMFLSNQPVFKDLRREVTKHNWLNDIFCKEKNLP